MYKHLIAGLFTSLALFLLGYIGELTQSRLLIAPFGASCVLLFGFPESPLVKIKNLVFGHLLSSVVGIFFLYFFSGSITMMAVASGVAISLMLITKTAHPAAGANPILIMSLNAGWKFLVTPILAGVILLIVLSFFHRWYINK